MSGTKPWWTSVEPEVERLAKRIAARHGHPVDTLALPYMPLLFTTGGGDACIITEGDMRPLWTFEVNVARHALEQRDTASVEAVMQMTDMETFSEASPDEAWRKETGLDGTES